ncbi:hypothetical protein AAA534_14470 [Pseudomonas aeruginosa]
MNMFLKFMALILCGGASVAIAFMRFKVLMEPEVALIFFTIGAVISLIVGVPLLLLLEWRFHRYRLRYVVGGLVCSLLGWLIFEGAFFPGAWEKIWTSSFFWNQWAPRRAAVFSVIGLCAGTAYTIATVLIDKKFWAR